MKLANLEEPILDNPQKFMRECFLVAQELYGKHTESILHFEGYVDRGPSMLHESENSIKKIWINKKAKIEKYAVAFQFAHEVVHCLMPNENLKWTSVLEEGLATDFSLLVMDKFGYKYDHIWEKPGNYNYYYALKLIRKTKLNNPEVIRKLREIQPSLTKIKKEDILKVIDVKPQDIDILLSDFNTLPNMKLLKNKLNNFFALHPNLNILNVAKKNKTNTINAH